MKINYIYYLYMASSLLALLLFTFLTIFYFIAKYFMYNSSQFKVIAGIYVLLVIVTQYLISLSAIKEKCGNNNYVAAFTVTAFPWVFIFGILYVVMTMFPSWKAPFSNTLGYLVVRFAGVRTLLIDNILKKDAYKQGGGSRRYRNFSKHVKQKGGENEEDDSNISSVKELTKALQHIYSDPSLLINELTPENYDTFWTRMKPLFKSNAGEYKDSLLKMVILKDIVSELTWYLLTGMLVTSMVANSIANRLCNYSMDEMKKNQEESEKSIEKADETKQNEKPRVYESKE